MTIQIDDTLFHLQTDHVSYVFHVMANGELGQLYYGPKIHAKTAYANLAAEDERGSMPALAVDQPAFQLEMLKQEFAGLARAIIDTRLPD